MKMIPIVATLVVSSFAVLGFAAGHLLAGQTRGNPPAQMEEATAQDTAPARPARDTQADAILQAAESQAGTGVAQRSGPASADLGGTGPGARPHVVKMANVTLPVRKAASISFVVADLAVAVRDAESAAHYEIPQNAARLQAAIEHAMASAADTQILRGVTIDSQQLSGKLTSELQANFADVEDVLFLTLYKHDVGYN